MKEEPYLLTTLLRKDNGGSSRCYGLFRCFDCLEIFESRFERIGVMSGRCRACANIQGGKKRATHGFNNTNSRLHVTWANMKRRCVSPVGKEKNIYKGVELCQEWHEFEPFMEWAMKNGYTDKATIDRVDGALGYTPGNCRFAGYSTQSANRRITDKNTSGYIGVTLRQGGRWRAKIQWKGKQVEIGTFDTREKAALARDIYIIQNNLPHTTNIIGIKAKYRNPYD